MARRGIRYTAEFVRECVGMVDAGRSYYSVARERGVSTKTLRGWCQKAGVFSPTQKAAHAYRESCMSAARAEEIVRLRCENEDLRRQLSILAATVAQLAGKHLVA
ncbi:transposase [Geminicoccus harenae]|uniref:transposase n=1 Tax=Geminicoccus harenae TaxID=2498453 RepID=UPI00168B7C4B